MLAATTLKSTVCFVWEASHKKTKRVDAREHGEVGRRGKPDLDVEEAAADLGPLEGFFSFEGWAIYIYSNDERSQF